jgi:hypothetical protein
MRVLGDFFYYIKKKLKAINSEKQACSNLLIPTHGHTFTVDRCISLSIFRV